MPKFVHLWVGFALALGGQSASAQVSFGTAFAVAPELLITNQHVVDQCSSVDILGADGRRRATVRNASAEADLALIHVSGLKGAVARLRVAPQVKLGEPVMVFGFPLAGSLSSGGNFTAGLVSALRGLRDAAGELQITAPVQPGNSGGPLLDASGAVIGVVQAKLDALRAAVSTGDIPQNVNFAVSMEVLADYLSRNRVPIVYAKGLAVLPTERVASIAQGFTYRVECQSRPAQAVAPLPREADRPVPQPPRAQPNPPHQRTYIPPTDDYRVYCGGRGWMWRSECN